MKILITGASGMVGKNILEHPKIEMHEVLAPKRSELDLSNLSSVEAYLYRERPEMVIHAAGRVGGIQANIKNPVQFLVENIDINRNLISACRTANIKKLLNLGSSCMYPRDAENPLREEMILKGELEPTNEGYALAKVMAQRLCDYITREDSSFQYKTLVPCNLYGRHDKFSPEHSHLIPAVIRKIHLAKVNNQAVVDIWGTGEARREFMYSADIADCILACVEKFESVPSTMNVGIGRDFSVNEYYQAAAEVIGFQGKFEHDLSKPVGMKQKLVSIDRLSKWGWKSPTSLHDGIEKTYKFFLEQEK